MGRVGAIKNGGLDPPTHELQSKTQSALLCNWKLSTPLIPERLPRSSHSSPANTKADDEASKNLHRVQNSELNGELETEILRIS